MRIPRFRPNGYYPTDCRHDIIEPVSIDPRQYKLLFRGDEACEGKLKISSPNST